MWGRRKKDAYLIPVFVFVPNLVVSGSSLQTRARHSLDFSGMLAALRQKLPLAFAQAPVPAVAVSVMEGRTASNVKLQDVLVLDDVIPFHH